MTKTLQQIKNDVAIKGGYKDWMELMRMTGDFGQDTASDQVAIRYAQEQKRELLEMLNTYLNDLNNIFPRTDACVNRMNQVNELIKSETEG